MSLPKLYYFNALFDLALGDHTSQALIRTSKEMTSLFIPMGTCSDMVLLHASVPDNYRTYLESAHLSLPEFVSPHFSARTDIQGEPWGWDEKSIKLFSNMGINSVHPDPANVRFSNSREFCHYFSKKEGSGTPDSTLFHSVEEFNIYVANGNLKYPLVIKPAFGNSGFGFVHISSTPDSSTLRKIHLLINKGSVIAEPWLKRIADFSSSLTLHQDGTFSNPKHYRCHVDSHGSFYGVHLPADNTLHIPARKKLEEKIITCTKYLHHHGYFGPVGFDSFSYTTENGHVHLAPIIEINARHVISDIARNLKEKLAPGKHVFYRFLSKKKCRLPSDYDSLKSILGQNHFSCNSRKGILAVTPLRITTDITRQPYRNAFFLAADSENELFELDRFLLEKTNPTSR